MHTPPTHSLKAILGPTNTGKTHYAIERMVAHASGMIGLPLRLLAREVYDRIVERKGAAHVALLTGEERIIPKTARYWVCTVESMPTDKQVEFVAIDEIQLAEDFDRGHVFTDRILNMRGTAETLLLGADTMRDVLRAMGVVASTETRERFSEIKYVGPTKITKLPKRTAIVAFSADEVYAIAELLRRQKGGAAVVMGALSPRTRNAQVAMYQAGEVDYIVATDAIGMGLNLDVDRVVFAARTKFDGRRHRALTASECAQIAGRAGRFRSDGEFGETADCTVFDEELWKRIEDHRFDPVDAVQWRNSDLDYSSLKALVRSLERPSGNPVLIHNPRALDEWVLRRMAEDESVGPDVKGAQNVRRLWDLARLPDFRKAGPEGHGRLVLGLAETLADPDARLSDAGMERRLEELATPAQDIARLGQRLAAIRTWTYAAHRNDWLASPEKWRQRTREIEDSLSDALHEALMARFVDRRTTQLLASLSKEDALVTDLTPDGDVTVEGHVVGRLRGLTFEPVLDAKTLEGKAVRAAAEAAIKPLLTMRLAAIVTADRTRFTLSDTGAVLWKDAPIARLVKGGDWLLPDVVLIGGEEAAPAELEAARIRLQDWTREEIRLRLPAHAGLKYDKAGDGLEGIARGLAFRVMERGAAVDLRGDDPGMRIEAEQRDALKALGLRAGRVAAYAPDAQKPAAQRLVSILRTVFDAEACKLAPEGAGSFALDGTWPDEALEANGYLRFGRRAVRADLAERLAWEVSKCRKEAGKNAFAIPIDLASVVSTPGEDFPGVLKGFGLAPAEKDPETGAPTLWRYAARRRPEGEARPPRGGGRRPGAKQGARGSRPERSDGKAATKGLRKGGRGKPPARQPDPDSPFAALAALLPPPPAPKPKKKKRKAKSKAGIAPAEATPEVGPATTSAAEPPIPDAPGAEAPAPETPPMPATQKES
jgi:ATP-dependent RNA helicase SUPV3L1/SUV3